MYDDVRGMSEDAYIDCNHNPVSEVIQLDKTSGEGNEPMCECHNDVNKDLVHREIDPKAKDAFVHQVENALITSILVTLHKKSVIPKTVYENAVNLLVQHQK